ncbi:MAG: Ig-like domain-containing protein [Planctomycetota bacterium]
MSTDEVVGATNVADESDDFNFTLGDNDPLFVNAAGNDFLPNGSVLIDSAINAVDERDSLLTVKDSIGLPTSNVVSPIRDVRGVLRQDNPNFATPGALGFSVFKDRGSNELADFVGPFATTEVPQDNDAEGIDLDPSTGFINLSGGILEEFRIQLRDTGDESDPFAGFGVDDRTVVVPEIPGLRPTGANLTLFEDDRLLTEGVDYTFNYDETKNVITLTPLAGIWKNDRAYRIALNNQDRTVLVAPDPSLVTDGDQVTITDSAGGTLVFEFEIGYSLLLPEPITMVIPRVGTNAGGVSDGDIFQIDDGENPIIVFELDNNNVTLPNTVVVPLPPGQTPSVEEDLREFLDQIAQNLGDAIQSQVDAGNLNASVRVLRTQSIPGGRITPEVVVGTESGSTLNTTISGLQQKPRTLAFRVPDAGTGVGGIEDGDSFIVDNGVAAATFEFDDGSGLNNNTNIVVPITPGLAGPEVAQIIADTISEAGLSLNPLVEANGEVVYLNLPLDGEARIISGQMDLVGVSRTPVDGDTVIITPNDGSPDLTFEINRTDEPSPDGPMDDGVNAPNIEIPITRSTTADELAGRIENAIQSSGEIAGLSPNDLQVIDGGILSVGGEEGLGLAVTGSTLEVTGSPSVTGASTIEILGPLLLTLSPVGGSAISPGSVLVLTDDAGEDQIFEFLTPGFPSSGFNVVPYNTFDTADVIATNLVTAINAANIGIPASLTGSLGEISLGRIDDSRVNTNGIFLPGPPPAFLPGLDSATVRRGIVSDGEILTIRQGPTTVGFEFEAAIGGGGVQPNNVAVPFELGSTVGDVAVALAAAINNNRGNLQVSAVAELDLNGDPTGNVLLNDQPGTEINVTRAPTLSVTGVPGGATPIRISPDFGPVEVKQALILAINSVNQPDRPAATTLLAEDRGGATFFVKNGVIFSGLIENFALPAITDFAGNPLEANRPDLSTQFTILMPTVGLDFGDAPDPRDEVPGRYPTTNANNGPRHVVGNDLSLGFFTDADTDGIPGVAANGDDRVIEISESVGLFNTSLVEDVPIQIDLDDQTFETMADLAAQIVVDLSVDPMTRDGDLITIQTGTSSATLEFDVNFRFDENHFAIRPEDPTSADSIAEAIGRAIAESPLTPASVSVDGDTVLINADDEDGVTFLSETNPTGVLNRGISTPIEVSVTGAGVLEAWIDFNADGDWNDPGEQIIPMPDNDTFDDLRSEICPTNLTGIASNIFAATGGASTRQFCIVVPPTTPEPQAPVTTYARFRISREGGLGPDGLALSGEVEDYALTLLPGLPPQIANPFLTYTVAEDEVLDAFDAFGTLNATTDDDGLLATVVDPDGDPVEIFADDVGQSELFVDGIKAGDLTVFDDGTFTFDSVNNFNGIVNFSVRVTDVQPLDPSTELVNSRPISVTINVTPVNDAPFATQTPVVIESDVLEDQDPSPTFGINELGALYLPGPTDEVDSGQTLILDSVFDENGNQLQTTMGGQLELSDDLTSVTYTPPADYFGPDTFFYVIADDLGVPTELPEEIGTVSLTVLPVNDAPRPENDADSIAAGVESITLLLRDNGNGLLDNDLPGPANEVGDPLFDTVELDLTNPFDDSNSAGNVELLLDGNNQVIGFTYERPELIDGADTFTYQVVDNFGATATGTVTIDVAGQNDPPVFNGTFVDTSGVVYTDSRIDLTESSDVNVISFDLSQSFTDPEGDALIFDAIVDPDTNDSGMTAEVNGNILTLTIPAFGFDGEGPGEGGGVLLTVTADDATNDAVSVDAAVFIAKVEDPPVVIDPANPVVLLGDEDIDVVKDLTEVFRDDDGDVLTYTLLSIDNIPVGDPTNIDHPLIESVQFVDDADNPTGPGDELLITLNDDQSGSAQFRISATDPTNRTSGPALFLLDISPVADAPVGVADEREAPIGSRVQELDPANGLLANDSDADGDGISVIPITDEVGDFGTLTVNADGTFVYTVATPEFPSAPGEPPKVDTFQYQIVDDSPDALVSDPIDLRFELTPSRYQNPMVTVIDGEPVQLRWDVTGDGFVTPIDALRIINFIDRRGTNIPVSEIGAPPPDFLDVNGNGQVEVLDALQVINRLDRDSQADGEMLGNAEGEFLAPVAAAVSSGYASGSMVNLPSRNVELVTDSPSADETLDSVLAGGLEISSSANTSSMDWVDDDDESASNDEVDAALSALLGDEDLTGDDV